MTSNSKKAERKLVRLYTITALLLSLVCITALINTSISKEKTFKERMEELESRYKGKTLSSEFGPIDVIKDPEIAMDMGVKGYLNIRLAENEKTIHLIEREKEYHLNIIIELVSYSDDLKEANVILDPKSRSGLTIEKSLGDGKGIIKLNDYVTYEPSGILTLKPGDQIPVKVCIKFPKELPAVEIPFGAIGITSDVIIIDDVEGKLCVS